MPVFRFKPEFSFFLKFKWRFQVFYNLKFTHFHLILAYFGAICQSSQLFQVFTIEITCIPDNLQFIYLFFPIKKSELCWWTKIQNKIYILNTAGLKKKKKKKIRSSFQTAISIMPIIGWENTLRLTYKLKPLLAEMSLHRANAGC